MILLGIIFCCGLEVGLSLIHKTGKYQSATLGEDVKVSSSRPGTAHIFSISTSQRIIKLNFFQAFCKNILGTPSKRLNWFNARNESYPRVKTHFPANQSVDPD